MIPEVKQWSAEIPNLYTFNIQLIDEQDPDNNQYIQKPYWVQKYTDSQ